MQLTPARVFLKYLLWRICGVVVHRKQEIAQDVLVGGMKRQRCSPKLDRFAESALIHRNAGEIAVGISVVGSKGDGAAEGLFGFIEPVIASQQKAECVEGFGPIGRERD